MTSSRTSLSLRPAILPKRRRYGTGFEIFFFGIKIFFNISSADGPEIRIIPIPPDPVGVAIAAIVSLLFFFSPDSFLFLDYLDRRLLPANQHRLKERDNRKRGPVKHQSRREFK